jgi:hypothetical protein
LPWKSRLGVNTGASLRVTIARVNLRRGTEHRDLEGAIDSVDVLAGEYAMTSPGPYDSETVTLLRDVLEDAWERLTFEQRARTQKSEVAQRILRLARKGERDPMRLRADAITGAIADISPAAEIPFRT